MVPFQSPKNSMKYHWSSYPVIRGVFRTLFKICHVAFGKNYKLLKTVNYFRKISMLDIWQDSTYASELLNLFRACYITSKHLFKYCIGPKPTFDEKIYYSCTVTYITSLSLCSTRARHIALNVQRKENFCHKRKRAMVLLTPIITILNCPVIVNLPSWLK